MTTWVAELQDALGGDGVLTDPDVTAAFDDILALGLSLGGTITGEHGVGTITLDWLEREIGPVSLDVHRSIEGALDPAGLLNPGTVFRPAGPTAHVVR